MSYYEFFDKHAGGGKGVFATDFSAFDDLPTTMLTPTEADERSAWRQTMQTIFDHYDNLPGQKVTTTELLLQQRVMIPNLESASISSRSQFKAPRHGRRYPATISEWEGFRLVAEACRPEHKALKPKYYDIFQMSMFDSSPNISLSDEKEEEGYMLGVLKKSIMTAGLLGRITSRGGLGKPDAITLNEDVELASPTDIGLIVEFKSTHNLPLPMTAAGVVDMYNAAYQAVILHRLGRTNQWSRVCHPIAQLLGYMVENGRRYGVLSSATRAYFVWIEGDGEQAEVHISDAWFVGEPNFLRAWAYMHSLASQQSNPLVSRSLQWRKTSSDSPTPPPKRKYQGALRSGVIEEGDKDEASTRDVQGAGFTAQMSKLQEIPFESLGISRALGYGRNGVVFQANWNGRQVALKQFDVGKGDGYESFQNEVAAYLSLEPVWGSLVATPLFVSMSWSGLVRFIGLQLGRNPLPGDHNYLSERTKVLRALEEDYGFRHEDADRSNMIFVLDEETNTERLVAIDLESYTTITSN